jgi:hypothetical protein
MIQILLAFIASLGGSIGGKIGALITQLTATIGTVTLDKAEWDAFAGPWIQWANAIVDANRDPTDGEHNAARALADAVHANNQSLATGGPGVQLPSPPAA